MRKKNERGSRSAAILIFVFAFSLFAQPAISSAAPITYTFDSDTQGWTGDLTFWSGAISSGTNVGSVNSYPPSARYIQTSFHS